LITAIKKEEEAGAIISTNGWKSFLHMNMVPPNERFCSSGSEEFCKSSEFKKNL